MTGKILIGREEIEFIGKRIRYHSSLSFDDVLADLRAHVGEASIRDILNPSLSRAEFESKVQQSIGDSGFLLFLQMDHGGWMEKFGYKRRLIRWIFGNPLVAITMLRHDYVAGLFVPPDLLLAENEGGAGCNITYVLPSSLMVVESNPSLLSAALALDAKIEALVARATSAQARHS